MRQCVCMFVLESICVFFILPCFSCRSRVFFCASLPLSLPFFISFTSFSRARQMVFISFLLLPHLKGFPLISLCLPGFSCSSFARSFSSKFFLFSFHSFDGFVLFFIIFISSRARIFFRFLSFTLATCQCYLVHFLCVVLTG